MRQDGRRTNSIVFASIAAGGSHISTATAMKEAIESEYPDKYVVEVLDIMKAFGFDAQDRRHKAIWKAGLELPRSIVLIQHMIDSSPVITNATLRMIVYEFARTAARRFKESPPALIVANHGWTVVAMTMAQRRFGLDIPVVSFETSTLNANALWAEPEAERFVVGSDVSRRRLFRLGVPREKIDVVGYPIRASFLKAPGKREARDRIGLADRFTVLISLGGEGVGAPVRRVLEALRRFDGAVETILIAGRNRGLYREASQLALRFPALRVEKFVSNMADYVAASDVVIGKTGPAATYETLAIGRPVLVPKKSGLAENKMLGVLERNGIGWFTPTGDEIYRRVRGFLDRPEELVEITEISRGFDFPGMAQRLARYLDGYATDRSPRASECDRGLKFLVRGAVPIVR